MTKKQINKAIAYTGLKVEGKPGDGCYYFVDRETDSAVGKAASVYIGRLCDLKKSQWIEEAEHVAQIRDTQARIKCDVSPVIILR